jgi:hypothetical protein|mmetsp:Transcript_16041/g.34748  ORF Transcript_16041/g.34748 Transcript_16041/m.34748 type:complete len:169 (+) Transcript_16041:103-609(+)
MNIQDKQQNKSCALPCQATNAPTKLIDASVEGEDRNSTDILSGLTDSLTSSYALFGIVDSLSLASCSKLSIDDIDDYEGDDEEEREEQYFDSLWKELSSNDRVEASKIDVTSRRGNASWYRRGRKMTVTVPTKTRDGHNHGEKATLSAQVPVFAKKGSKQNRVVAHAA